MILPLFDSWPILPIAAYAETHFRFRFIPSLLFKREPEVIADTPHRVEPGNALPILILIKDADRYPIVLRSITASLRGEGIANDTQLHSGSLLVREKLWWNVFDLPVDGCNGWISVNVDITFERGGRLRRFQNDNLRTSSRSPLRVFVANSQLPGLPNLAWGEAHAHSQYTSDQVEFGSPLSAARHLATSLGLKFFCATDHSYDLDDSMDDYLKQDPELTKWKQFQSEIDSLNSNTNDFVIVRGEEVSCRNAEGRNIHLLLYGTRKFFYGSGDGAENGLNNRSEHTAEEVFEALEESTSAFAAHAMEPVPFVQRLLLNRGTWQQTNLDQLRLSGIQFANGRRDVGFDRGYQVWIAMLLKGRKVFTIAGNDAHGNFNRFRQVQIPHVALRESHDQLFGKMRTGLFTSRLTEENLLSGFARGSMIISDGPAGNIVFVHETEPTSMGKTYSRSAYSVRLLAISTREFGSLKSVTLFRGIIGEHRETELLTESLFDHPFHREKIFEISPSANCYIRFEIHTHNDSADSQSHFCFSNPVWLLGN